MNFVVSLCSVYSKTLWQNRILIHIENLYSWGKRLHGRYDSSFSLNVPLGLYFSEWVFLLEGSSSTIRVLGVYLSGFDCFSICGSYRVITYESFKPVAYSSSMVPISLTISLLEELRVNVSLLYSVSVIQTLTLRQRLGTK